ncbi:MAG TPA: Tm-1-like ATP-binding domain-containing protein [Chloroflexota bacterium]|nr:Tm-1-like ATP-binding domain-containing protein [Chloroflexota bacterium]
MKTVVLIGTLDTKAEDFAFVRDALQGHGLATLMAALSTGC